MKKHIYRGEGAPDFTPPKSGYHYIDELNGVAYTSVGTSSADDWKAEGAGNVLAAVLTGLDTGTGGEIDATDTLLGAFGKLQNQITNIDVSGPIATHAAVTSGVHGISTFGATLVDDANAGAARTTLGLGTAALSATGDFEASGSISTHAALTSGVHGITAFAATLLDDANAGAFRTTLGLGTAALSATGDFEASGAIATHAALTSSVHGITAAAATVLDDTTTAAMLTTLGALALAGGTMTGHLLFTDNTYDIGASGATRPRTGYFGTSVVSPLFTGALTGNVTGNVTGTVTGSASLNVLKAGDTMTGALAIGNGTITASTPLLDLSQTWNASGTTFAALKINVTNTASALASKLLDLQVGGSTLVSILKGGYLGFSGFGLFAATVDASAMANIYASGARIGGGVGQNTWQVSLNASSNGELILASTGYVCWASVAGPADLRGSVDLQLFRDAADTLAQRRTTNAQTFRLYNTYTDASNYERSVRRFSSNIYEDFVEAAGTGTQRQCKRYYDKAGNVFDSAGAGTPEGAVTAGIGSTWRRTDGGAGTTFYVKESGTGNTGWVAK